MMQILHYRTPNERQIEILGQNIHHNHHDFSKFQRQGYSSIETDLSCKSVRRYGAMALLGRPTAVNSLGPLALSISKATLKAFHVLDHIAGKLNLMSILCFLLIM